jgi:Flp pilus assembly protein TadD
VDRAIKMHTAGAFDPLREDAKLRSLREAVAASPENLTARLHLAQRYEGYGLADEALEEYAALAPRAHQAAGGSEPSSILAAVLFGVARNGLRAGRAGDALEVLKDVGASTADAQFSLQLGLLYDQVGDFDRAEAAYRQAVQMEPALAAAGNNLGYRLLRRSQLEEAELHFRQAIAAGSVAARNNLGMLLTQRGDHPGAWEQFQAGSKDLATARNNYAVALMTAGNWMESREQLVLALRERRGFAEALRNFRIVQDHIRSAGGRSR